MQETFKAFGNILPSYFCINSKDVSFYETKTYSVWLKNVKEYFNNCAGDRQWSYGGFIALIGVIA